MPGRWLLAIASAVFDHAVVADVVRPTIADLQHEWITADVSWTLRSFALLRGYCAFWSLVVMSPFAFAAWPRRSNEPRFPVLSILLGAAILLALALRLDVSKILAPVMNRLPEGTMGVLGSGSIAAVLAGPMLLAGLLVRRWRAGSGAMQIRSAEVTLVGLLSVSLTSLLCAAGLIGVFEGIGMSGSAGLGLLTTGVVGATQPMLAAIGTGMAFAVVALLMPRGDRTSVADVPALSRRKAIGLSIALCVTVLAVDRLLAAHHAFLQDVLAVLELPRTNASGNGLAAVQAIERSFGLILAGGVLLTLLTCTASLIVWRGTRAKVASPLFRSVSRAVAVAVLAGGIWHGAHIKADLDAYRDNAAWIQSRMQGR